MARQAGVFVGRVRAWFALAICACVLLACARTVPEARLRATIDALQQDLESRDLAGLSAVVAEDFVGPEGMGRSDLRRLAQASFLRYRSVGVSLGPMHVDMAADERHATVRFTAALTGGDGAMLPESARVHTVESGWREDDEGEWELTSLDWDAME